eukprot:12913902-Prorocentrum_lima.AAC.1
MPDLHSTHRDANRLVYPWFALNPQGFGPTCSCFLPLIYTPPTGMAVDVLSTSIPEDVVSL